MFWKNQKSESDPLADLKQILVELDSRHKMERKNLPLVPPECALEIIRRRLTAIYKDLKAQRGKLS